MRFPPLLNRSARTAAPLLLALLLAVALMPAAALANPIEQEQPGETGENDPNSLLNLPVKPGDNQNENENENENQNGNGNGNGNENGNGNGNGNEQIPTTPTDPAQPHPSAPFTPPADCIVAHAATPAQLCSVAGGMQYYFIGADGSSQQGPWIQPFSELATLHSAGAASLYSGTNPKTGKSVQIHYLASENKIRVSTFYPDTQYDTNKPYNFTVDSNNSVAHEAW